MNKRIFAILIALILILSNTLSGCGLLTINESESDGKIKIVTTLFPQYDFAKQITGDKANVSLLLPPGVESHSYDPTPRDIINLDKADVFIYTGEFMEPWAHRVIDKIKNDNIIIVEAGKNINLIEDDHEDDGESLEEEESHEEEESSHDNGNIDPHIWLDPVLGIKMLENILEGIVIADPENEEFYIENAAKFEQKLQKLHQDFEDLSEKVIVRTIVHGGHFAFGYFAARYNLEYISPYEGFSPNSEPTTQRIAQLIENLKNSGTNVIYYEELIQPRVAQIISDETDARMLMLHAAHNISKQELDEGVTYIDIMYQNLENLKIGLGYE